MYWIRIIIILLCVVTKGESKDCSGRNAICTSSWWENQERQDDKLSHKERS